MLRLTVLLLAGSVAACSGGMMVKADKAPVPNAGESLIVFMPSALNPTGASAPPVSTGSGIEVSASVFDVSGPEPKLIGLVGNNEKVAYPLKPGQHTFMLV